MAATIDNAYELERQKRIAENRKVMADLGLLKQASILNSFRSVKQRPSTTCKPWTTNRAKKVLPPRRSRRLEGVQADYAEIDEHDRAVASSQVSLDEETGELVDLMGRREYREAASKMEVPPSPSPEAWEAIQSARCASQGRGSVYDSNAGITCHFCRQKKLCGEEGCERCSSRDCSKQCIGKTECSRCMGATGRFCRACLLIRYGQTLEEARVQMAEGTWLCPHCYEEEHPQEGWICNSSICMKRRGLKPTGIAIYDAHERGYKSVAHLLQAELQKRGPSAVLGSEQDEAAAATACCTAKAPPSTQQAGKSSAASNTGKGDDDDKVDAAASSQQQVKQTGGRDKQQRGRPPHAVQQGGVCKPAPSPAKAATTAAAGMRTRRQARAAA